MSINKNRRIIFILITLFLLISGYLIYDLIFRSNIILSGKKIDYINIPTNSKYDDVLNRLKETKLIKNINSFDRLARIADYENHIHPGHFQVKNGINNYELVRLLYSGKQTPVTVTFNNVRLKSELASKVSKLIEADSISILNLLNDPEFIKPFGFTPETSILLCLPNTYEFWWNTSAEQFLKRMAKEQKKFWNESRLNKAKKIGLSPIQIGILASIVDQETNKNDEMSRIAGVYLNRLNKGMPLQADPTVKFALNDFSITRILKGYTEVDSPYNTYKYAGLPPGPICLPNTSTIDKVLNYEKHEFFYFCAREDFSGYHNFAENLEEHNINAKKYQHALSNLELKK